MSRRLARALVALIAACIGLGAAPALAQVPPLPVPAVPPEAQPVLEIVAPIVSPQCGNATLVVALAPGVVGSLGAPLPVNILPVLGPAFIICGTVPAPKSSTLLVCAIDDQTLAAIAQITVAAAGIPPPVDTRLVGPLVETTYVIEDNLPPPANTAGLADMAKATLACRSSRDSATPGAAAPAVDAVEPDVDASAFDDLALPDTLADAAPLAADGGGQQLGSAAAPAFRPVVDVGNPGFAYPVVFALPLIVLIVGGYLGFALTRPIAVDDPRA
ncbi:MAG TPA: hypothetical protein VFB78_15325 [Acidimicrobiales bacterium]|nr:hypothetical protein [Acidimicrobiales bacterium]